MKVPIVSYLFVAVINILTYILNIHYIYLFIQFVDYKICESTGLCKNTINKLTADTYFFVSF